MIYFSPPGLSFLKNNDRLSTESHDQHWDSLEIEIQFPPRRRGFVTIRLSVLPLFAISTRIEQCNKKLNRAQKETHKCIRSWHLLNLQILGIENSIKCDEKCCLSICWYKKQFPFSLPPRLCSIRIIALKILS